MSVARTAASDQSRSRLSRHPLYTPFLYLCIAMGAISLAIAVAALFRTPMGYHWLLLAALAVLSSPFTIRIPGTNSKISIGDTFYFTNVILYGIPAGVITSALDALVGSIRVRTHARRLEYSAFNIATLATSSLLGGSVFFWMTGRGPLSQPPQPTTRELLLPLTVLALLHYLWNSGCVAAIVALESRKPIVSIWKESFLWSSITYLAGALAAGFIAITIGEMSAEVPGVTFAVVVAVYYTYKTYLDKVGQLHTALHQVNDLAYYDVLTKLPNRVLYTEQLNRALAEAQAHRKRLAVMFLDLDRFKRINDTFGHNLGDLLLKGVAERLNRTVMPHAELARGEIDGPDALLSRFGGDEFTILWTNVNRLDDIARAAERILDALVEPLDLDGHEIFASVSIGISMYPEDGVTVDLLLRNADTAMYAAKDDGRAGYRFYANHMNERFLKNLSLENDLRRAVERKEFENFYQPKLDAQTGTVVGLEALIRWRHETRGLVMPEAFIPLAEETGLIVRIGELGLRDACAQSVAWREAGRSPLPVSVNLSCVQFRQKDLLERISRILTETSMDPRFLELELTESTVMGDVEESGVILRGLASLGIRLSIDDFGTGYSSLSYLKQFTLDTLKIDRSFIKDLSSKPNDRAITRAIIAMAHSLELRVVAEGVETEEHRVFLRDNGCDELQGFLFSCPLPVEEIEAWLDDALGSSAFGPTNAQIKASPVSADPDPPVDARGRSVRVH